MTQLPVTIRQGKIVADSRTHVVPTLVAAAGERASLRFLEFFAANIRNPHTRRAYGRAVAEFLAWCDDNGVPSVAAVQPLHVAAWIDPISARSRNPACVVISMASSGSSRRAPRRSSRRGWLRSATCSTGW